MRSQSIFDTVIVVSTKVPARLFSKASIDVRVLMKSEPLAKPLQPFRWSECYFALGFWDEWNYVCEVVVHVTDYCADDVVFSIIAKNDNQQHKKPRQELGSKRENLHDVHLHLWISPAPEIQHRT